MTSDHWNQGKKLYTVDESFFETINTEEKAYWLGFTAADGCISFTTPHQANKSKPRFALKLKIDDRSHLEKFREALNCTYPIRERPTNKGHKSAAIYFVSWKMYNDLLKQGVPPRKSLILEPPTGVPESLINHWIRGYFDGDGCISKKVTIAGTKNVLDFIRRECNIEGSIRPKGNIWRYSFGALKKVEAFYYYLYNNASIFLERKYCNFKEGNNRYAHLHNL